MLIEAGLCAPCPTASESVESLTRSESRRTVVTLCRRAVMRARSRAGERLLPAYFAYQLLKSLDRFPQVGDFVQCAFLRLENLSKARVIHVFIPLLEELVSTLPLRSLLVPSGLDDRHDYGFDFVEGVTDCAVQSASWSVGE